MKKTKRRAKPLNESQLPSQQDEGRTLVIEGKVHFHDHVEEHVVAEACIAFREVLEKFGKVEMEANIKQMRSVNAVEFLSKAEPTPENQKGKSLIRDGYVIPKVIGEENGSNNT